MKTESVKIDAAIVRRIRKYIKSTGQTISGYININLDKCLVNDERKQYAAPVDKLHNNKSN